MVVIDDIKITPNPVNINSQFTISIELHEETDTKKYPYEYPFKYCKKEGR